MRTKANVILALLLSLLLLLAGCGSENSAQAAGPDNGKADDGLLSKIMPQSELVVPAGTPITIRLQQPISSANAGSGDRFDFVLAEPLVIDGKTVADKGTPGEGRVITVRHSGRLHNAGFLRITVNTLEVRGVPVEVKTSSISVSGGRYRNRNLAWIGGGAGAGALIGGLAGGGKGALVGSLIGAGGGTAGAYATGKKDVGFSTERVLTFKITQPVKIRG